MFLRYFSSLFSNPSIWIINLSLSNIPLWSRFSKPIMSGHRPIATKIWFFFSIWPNSDCISSNRIRQRYQERYGQSVGIWDLWDSNSQSKDATSLFWCHSSVPMLVVVKEMAIVEAKLLRQFWNQTMISCVGQLFFLLTDRLSPIRGLKFRICC